MKVRFRKSPPGKPHVMSCRRADGTETYGPIPGHPGIPHDLIHLVVEDLLGLRRAFFGTVASGVPIPEAAGAWKTMPQEARAEAQRAELVVAWFQVPGARVETVPATADELAQIEGRLAELHAQWLALGPKDALELEWPTR
ncbi:MAG: hypothetical protein JWO36_531 [Myxococcales bacterium]|nr:hypothetical protein [Myxococcales bacterium]